MSDRIAVMSKGVVLQLGIPEEIYERPANRFVADFIGETNFIEGVVGGQSNGVVSIQVDGSGILQVESSRSFGPGQQVSITVRPEKLRLNANQDGSNNLAGRAEEVIYIGTDTHYSVRFPGGQKVRVREQNSSARAVLAHSGDEVTVSFDPGAARVLTE
jgi:spermidine/putrescine transport system ATP-binding protein